MQHPIIRKKKLRNSTFVESFIKKKNSIQSKVSSSDKHFKMKNIGPLSAKINAKSYVPLLSANRFMKAPWMAASWRCISGR